MLLKVECAFSAFCVADRYHAISKPVKAIYSFLTNTPMCCAWFDLCKLISNAVAEFLLNR